MSLLLLNLVYVNQADFQQLVSFTFNFPRLLLFGVAQSTFTDGVRIKRGVSSVTPMWPPVNNHQIQIISDPSFIKTRTLHDQRGKPFDSFVFVSGVWAGLSQASTLTHHIYKSHRSEEVSRASFFFWAR